MSKVLVIDDDPGVRRVIRQALEDESIEVVEAEDGQQGLRKFSTHRPAVVVTDIVMPNMEGIETIPHLRTLSPSLRLIAISGGGRVAHKDFLETARRVGADHILPKPFDDEILVKMVKELLAAAAEYGTGGHRH
jgi:two-component system, chemotaxis family, chemotaxis protein CheY